MKPSLMRGLFAFQACRKHARLPSCIYPDNPPATGAFLANASAAQQPTGTNAERNTHLQSAALWKSHLASSRQHNGLNA